MKMTEKMKTVLQEEMAKVGVELSEEELDGVSGGRSMTQREEEECDSKMREYGKRYGSDLMYYRYYIAFLPDDAPEELYDRRKDYYKLWKDALDAAAYGDRFR